ncbi:MAG: ester cyclase [Gammaproteobacteria bacterium]
MQSSEPRKQREATVREHMESENLQRWDRTIATFAHPRYELIGSGQVIDGADAVMNYFKASRTVFPDQRNELIAMHHADDAVIVEFNLFGTHKGAMGPIAATGRSFKCRMVAVFMFQGDKITCERVYWDSATIMRQLGLGDRAAVS